MKKTYILLTAAAALTLGACTHKPHFEVDMPQDATPGKYSAPEGQGFLGNELTWEDVADVQSTISNLKFTVTGPNGVKEVHEFNNPAEASEWMIPLPAGDYDVLVTANMDADNGFELSETPPTKAGLTIPDTYAWLSDPSSNPDQVWNGIGHVRVENDKMATAHVDLDRLLAVFTLKFTHVPEGATIDVSMRNAAHYVTLTKEYATGHWGEPSAEISDDIVLGKITASNALTLIDEFKVLPTAKGLMGTILLFHIKTDKGLEQEYMGQAPLMENGKTYILELDYTKLTPYMFITAGGSINDWTETWIYGGEILNPETE